MNWDAIGAVGEILGAIAVFATLLYLAIQVRQNTASAAAATYDSALSGFNELNLTVADSEDLSAILTRGLSAPDSLSEIEQVRFAFLMRSGSNQFLKILHLHQRGALSNREWEALAQDARAIYETPGGKRFRSDHPGYSGLYEALDRLQHKGTIGFELGGEGTSP